MVQLADRKFLHTGNRHQVPHCTISGTDQMLRGNLAKKRLVLHTCADARFALVGSVYLHTCKLIYTPALTHVSLSH
jgi:hypothetical protein